MEIKLAPHQREAWLDDSRFQVRVWARRSGKTFYTILRMLARIQEEGTGDWQAFYIAPTRLQARQITWPYLAQFSQPLGGILRVADLKLELPGKGFIQLASGEQYERLRGMYADEVAIDETADVPENAWLEVISPMISDRKGRATFIGTPRGRLNMLWKMYEQAGDQPDWSRGVLNWEQAGMLEAEEVERNRKQMTEAQFNQEFMCSWSGSTPGAYWAKEMSDAEESGRVTDVRYDDTIPVVAAIDLGHHDLMPAIFCQEAGTEHRIIHCKTYEQTSLPDMVRDWRDTLPFPVDKLIVPHDARVRELGSGKTRVEVLRGLGLDVTIAPNQPLNEGIEQTRQFIKNCWFDRDGTTWLREGLASYRSEYDDLRGVYRLIPIHDQASHYADAMRYLALGDRRALGTGWGERPALRTGTNA